MKPNLIAAFNELKTIKEWAKDERCKVPYITLKDRLKKGKDPEWALTEPFQKSVAGREVKVGDKLHRLTIKKLYFVNEYGQNKTYADCECECGNFKSIKLAGIIDGNSTSCGCYKSEVKSKECSERNYKHGKSNIDYPLYKTWCNIKARCYTSSSTQFKDYGGRGIKVCDKWREDFKIFESWALSNGYQEDLTIERINFNGNYEPCNCRWISIQEQQKNKRDNIIITAWNETKILSDWIMDNRCKTRQQTISLRIKRGWFPEKAISTETNYRSERNEFIRLKNIWKGIIGRCYNLNHISYKYFGAKGIKLCNEWKDNFPQFLHWSLLNGYNSDKSIDRLNINGDYCPFNCRWATTKEQSRNKSNNIKITAWKECKVLADWLKDNRCKVGHKVIVYRLNNGWNPEEAISTLPYKKRLI